MSMLAAIFKPYTSLQGSINQLYEGGFFVEIQEDKASYQLFKASQCIGVWLDWRAVIGVR